MITKKYLEFLQEDMQPLNEFVFLPLLLLIIKVYANNFSDAARSCIGHDRASKKICILEYKLRATIKIQNDLSKLLKRCSTDKNPGKCIVTITKKLTYFKEKERKLREQLAKENSKL